jgi:N-acetylneuraminate synthase
MAFDYSYRPAQVIAEIGCNHKGDMEIARELIRLAKEAGADVAKFQKRDNRLLLTEAQYNAPHPVPENSYGETYGLHREFLEFDQEQHRALKAYCESIGIVYATSVWEANSARMIAALDPEFIKVPSACNNNFEMLRVLRDEYRGDVHLSFGMTTRDEERAVVDFFEEKGQAKSRLIVYACTSGYPVPYSDVSLLEINRLYDHYENRVKAIGFSGHHLGTAVDIAAYTLGARWIERHFTKDRTWKGTDHGASLEPRDLEGMITDLKHTHEALTFKSEEILGIEQVQREKLKNRK